jgi:flavin-dependent dehydrogenase
MTGLTRFVLGLCAGLAAHLALAAVDPATQPAPATGAQVVVYEGTPAGVMAAVAAARHGHSVLLIEMNNHLGGVVAGGLTSSDIGDRATVGGLADEFFKRVVQYYTVKYGLTSAQMQVCKNGVKFEPHVAEAIFDAMVAEQPGITVWKNCRYHAVEQAVDGKITALVTEDSTGASFHRFTGDMFIDASYEGDLMAGAHVPYVVGREARSQYGEYLAA